jgi:hypothetical protein
MEFTGGAESHMKDLTATATINKLYRPQAQTRREQEGTTHRRIHRSRTGLSPSHELGDEPLATRVGGARRWAARRVVHAARRIADYGRRGTRESTSHDIRVGARPHVYRAHAFRVEVVQEMPQRVLRPALIGYTSRVFHGDVALVHPEKESGNVERNPDKVRLIVQKKKTCMCAARTTCRAKAAQRAHRHQRPACRR